MSTTTDGRWIRCDGDGCAASERALVGLHARPGRGPATAPGARGPLAGWLFVTRGRAERTDRHFCPSCARAYLLDPTG
jgi:hypothetical protein